MIKAIQFNIDFDKKELSISLDEFYIQWFSRHRMSILSTAKVL